MPASTWLRTRYFYVYQIKQDEMRGKYRLRGEIRMLNLILIGKPDGRKSDWKTLTFRHDASSI